MIASAALSLVQSYIDDVTSGDAVVCELVSCAVQRHLDDLEWQGTAEFPYYFDSKAAADAVDFFPTCLRHSIGEFVGEPFYLEPWQAFAVANIFGWKRISDNTRRFRKVYWSTGRKNGKSTWAAGMAIRLGSMDWNPITETIESVADVILSATKKEQAQKVIYAEIERMIAQSPDIKSRSTTINKQVTFTHNQGSIRCVGSDKSYDGLNPALVVMDELHEFKNHHLDFYNTMESGGGSRSQPLDVKTTTAGSDASDIWIEVYEYSAGVVRGLIKDEHVFCWCFELDEKDDPLDEANWIKANPNLGVCLKLDYLQQAAIGARLNKIALNRFTRYHGNRMVSSTASAFELELWDACAGELSDWADADTIGLGMDLGGRDDLSAFGAVARFPVETDGDDPVWRYEIRTQAYIAEDSKRDLTKPPFAEWCHRELIRVCKYPNVALVADVIQFCRDYYVRDVAYDRYNAQTAGEELRKEGIIAEPMAQTYAFFHEPISDFAQAMQDGRLRHDGNPLLRWCIRNAVLVEDMQERTMFTKRDSAGKIDPVVAVVMGYWRAMVAPRRPIGSMFIT